MTDELLRRGRSRAYALRQDNMGFEAKLIEDLCEALEKALAPPKTPISPWWGSRERMDYERRK